MAKKIFVVKVCWKTYGEHRIEAETAEQANQIALNELPLPTEETGQDNLQIIETVLASDPMEDGEEEG